MSLLSATDKSPPLGLKWRSSVWFITFVIGLGIAVDLIIYSIIIPVIPFQLEHLGYSNVSSLSGWLLFSYSAGLVLSTIPIAMLSERYNSRQPPLIFGLLLLTGSQIMLMEAPNYPVMCIARILQGFGSSVVWVVGLALLCDTASPSTVALYIGFAMTGLSLGLVIGPAVGGALYDRFGFRGPFIFGIIATIIDLLGRIVMIERKEALKWGVDPAAPKGESPVTREGYPPQSEAPGSNVPEKVLSNTTTATATDGIPHEDDITQPSTGKQKHLSLIDVLVLLGTSPRTLVACFLLFAYGLVYSSQEPSIPVHLQRVWDLDSGDVGLIYIAAAVPSLFSSVVNGYLTDKYGAEWTTASSLFLSLPWWAVLIVKGKLGLFIASFAIQGFFTSSVIAPLTAELADISRTTEGVGYGHVYGALNLVFGIGSSVGPIIGGQIFDHLENGWTVLCLMDVGLLSVCVVLAATFTGATPLVQRMLKKSRNISKSAEN